VDLLEVMFQLMVHCEGLNHIQEASNLADNIKVSENEINLFKKELSIYMGIVLIPLNLICIAVMFMKGIPFIFPLAILLAIDSYFYKQIKQTFEDISEKSFVKKTGVLKRKQWGVNLNKFEYVFKDDPEAFSSFISRFNSFENHNVSVVYTKRTRKILKMWKV